MDSVLLPVHENGNSSAEMRGKNKHRNKNGATDTNDSSKDQQIAELTKQNKELNKKVDRLLELLAKEKERTERTGRARRVLLPRRRKRRPRRRQRRRSRRKPARRPRIRRRKPRRPETRSTPNGK